jgi:hypothetical protein
MRICPDHDKARAHIAVLGEYLVADPPTSPRMSWNFRIMCLPTKSRTFFWFPAVFADSAGTRWSKMIATRDGSQITGSRPVPLNTSKN